ncbi:MAG: hypothetical protein COV66_05535 [Nitrospinae bacterium CG11_big_fil_rev_8_21_14_0_20_45_15]|nr:MAG: hypothetical protein COV66_05535 [Nitrospinae bacterium CG11_big_fil_rev_8_21_14_0_20_45_15]
MSDKSKKQVPPFSLRLTFEERARLEKDSAGMSLGAYIRSRLFDSEAPKRRTRGKHPVKDHTELGKLLGELGRSRIANNLNQLAKAANSGSLEVSPDTEQAIQDSCNDIQWIRRSLIVALGLLPENDYDS